MTQADDDEYRQYEILSAIEEEYKATQVRYRESELLKIFPEVKKVLPIKVREWKEVEHHLVQEIRRQLVRLKQISKTEMDYWFGREVIKLYLGEDILNARRHIIRLKNLILVGKGRVIKGRLTEEDIYHAKQVPIAELYEGKLRCRGKNYVGLCPFHQEKHASFNIYPNNSCWCFGCQRGGNSINYVMLLYGYSFKEAVKYLIGK